MNQELKNKLQSFLSLCDSFDEEGLADEVRGDLLKFLVFLTFSDDEISEKETECINQYFDTDYDDKALLKWLRNSDMLSGSMSVPHSLVRIVGIDNELLNCEEMVTEYSMTLVELYKKLGMEIICSDKSLAAEEYADYDNYISMIETYISAALKTA